MNKHTPGPWACDLDMAKVYSVPTNLMVASISIPTNTACKDAWPADARLIAAAPDLLAVLKEATTSAVWRHPSHCECEVCEMCRAAIAKAEGRA